MSSSRETQQIEKLIEEKFDADGLGCARGLKHAVPVCILFWAGIALGLYWLMKG
jgi:hypothetical protein